MTEIIQKGQNSSNLTQMKLVQKQNNKPVKYSLVLQISKNYWNCEQDVHIKLEDNPGYSCYIIWSYHTFFLDPRLRKIDLVIMCHALCSSSILQTNVYDVFN